MFCPECVLRLPGEDVGEAESVSSVQSTGSGSGRSAERRKARASKKEGEAPPGDVLIFIITLLNILSKLLSSAQSLVKFE